MCLVVSESIRSLNLTRSTVLTHQHSTGSQSISLRSPPPSRSHAPLQQSSSAHAPPISRPMVYKTMSDTVSADATSSKQRRCDRSNSREKNKRSSRTCKRNKNRRIDRADTPDKDEEYSISDSDQNTGDANVEQLIICIEGNNVTYNMPNK